MTKILASQEIRAINWSGNLENSGAQWEFYRQEFRALTGIAPALFGQAAGPHPFWEKFDWGLALQEGAAYSGVPFSGTFGFPNTVMYLSVNHQIAPKEMALNCNACHGVPTFWAAVDLTDPLPGPH